MQTTEAAASAAVAAFGFPNCGAGGIYTIPAGKALIITGVDFYNHASGAGEHELDLTIGPASTPCSALVAAGVATDSGVSQNQSFHPGDPCSRRGCGGALWEQREQLSPGVRVPGAVWRCPSHFGGETAAAACRPLADDLVEALTRHVEPRSSELLDARASGSPPGPFCRSTWREGWNYADWKGILGPRVPISVPRLPWNGPPT